MERMGVKIAMALTVGGLVGATASGLVSCKAREYNKGAEESKEQGFLGGGEKKALGEETFEDDEAKKTETIVDLSLTLMKKNGLAAGNTRTREVHSKAHGCLRADFKVDDDLPAEFQLGVFQPGARYPTWVRASNGAPGMTKDAERQTSRGFALKLMNVSGKRNDGIDSEKATQDFLFVNGRRFFIKDLDTYIKFLDASNNERSLAAFLSGNPLKWPENGAMLIALLERTRLKIANPLEVPYFSAVPYSFAPQGVAQGAAKYKLEPCTPQPEQTVGENPPENYLRDAMRKTLQAGGACYRFIVMRQNDARKQPIEDSTVEWKQEDTQARAVATLTIPKQDFESSDNVQLCENASFHPWHGLEAHKPLGQMNRVRKVVYTRLAAARRAENGVAPVEPTPDATFDTLFSSSARP